MAADIHIMLGKVALKDNALLDFNNLHLHNVNLTYHDFTFSSVPDSIDVTRVYDLFSWLANVRGSVKPLDNQELNYETTRNFFKWYDKSYNSDYDGTSYFSYEHILDRLDLGDHSRVMYTVEFLATYDYDTVALVEDSDADSDTEVYMVHPERKTLRELFPEWFFQLIDYCKQTEHNFILFGFDS